MDNMLPQTAAPADMHILIQGAGRGIGLALAKRARAAGASQLFLTARDPQSAPGYDLLPPSDDVMWLTLEVTEPDSIAAASTKVTAATDQLDRVIFTAGMLQDGSIRPEKRINDIDADVLTRVFQTNALAPVLMARELWPLLRGTHPLHYAALSARVGSISDNALGGWYAYRASKAALNQLMRTLSIELARANPAACVASLHPGTVDTNLSRPFQANVPAEKLFTASYAADCLWQVLDGLDARMTGGFFAYDGSPIPF